MKLTSVDFFLQDLLANPFTMATVALAVVPLLLGVVMIVFAPRLTGLIVKNLGRNRVRTVLTCLATMVLVVMVTLIWTVIFFIDAATSEQAKNFKVIVTERWQLPSQMPMTYGNYLDPASPNCLYDPQKFGMDPEKDFMTWSFYGGSTDPEKRTLDTLVFLFVMNPDQIIPMMDDLEMLDPALIDRMKQNLRGVLMGKEKMRTINKRVGERFKLTSFNYKEVDLEFEIVGELPEGRYDSSAVMNQEYFNRAMDQYAASKGKPHPLSDRRLNLIWLRVGDKEKFQEMANIVENASVFTTPQVKCETASSGVAAFLDAYRDLLWGMKWLLVPAILASMTLVVANAIGISVRERMKEIAVMKVLGFRPGQVLILVLGESLLVGGLAGLIAAGSTFLLINNVIGGIAFPIAFFPKFFVPIHAFFWGLAMGFGTSFVGSFTPALSARKVRVSEVFSRVA